MNARVCVAVVVGFVASVFAPMAFAQQSAPENQQFLRIVQYIVQPPKAAKFQEVVREVVEQLNNDRSTATSFLCMRSQEVVFTFILPLTSISDREAQTSALAEAGQSLGADWAARASEAVEYTNEFLVIARPDLSYASENPRLSLGDVRHMHFDFHYLNFGAQAEAEQTAREYANLHKTVNCDTGFNVYEVVGGAELPILILATGAKSIADYYVQAEKVAGQLGPTVGEIADKRDSVVRRIERIDSTILPELSYQPETPSGN